MKKIFLTVALLFSSSSFAAEYGLFMIVEGDVIIINNDKPTPAKVNSRIQVGDSVATGEVSRAKIVMSDRNVINIAPKSRVKIQKYNNSESDKNVILELSQGSVRNDLEQTYHNSNSSFEVHTPVAVIGVRGTQFITSYDESEKATEVVTFSGRVNFRRRLTLNSNSFGESFNVDKGFRLKIRNGFKADPPIRLNDSEFNKINLNSIIQAKKEQFKQNDAKIKANELEKQKQTDEAAKKNIAEKKALRVEQRKNRTHKKRD